MTDPVLIELTRGGRVESRHAGAIALARPNGEIVAQAGDIAVPVFPRSAVKAMQAVPLIESGAADRFGFGAAEIALAAASHSGTERHVAVAAGMLARAGLSVADLGCGAHMPTGEAAARALIRADVAPTALNNNCSGKHAGMLATAVHLGEPTADYWRVAHPVQQRVAGVLEATAGLSLSGVTPGIDGCSLPNWPLPLAALAQAFARIGTGEGLLPERARTFRRIMEACWAEPDMMAGPGRLDTMVLERLPRQVFLKTGAEGVYCGVFPQLGLGFALKADDGAKRAAEAMTRHLIARLLPGSGAFADPVLRNWRGLEVGETRPAPALSALLDALPA